MLNLSPGFVTYPSDELQLNIWCCPARASKRKTQRFQKKNGNQQQVSNSLTSDITDAGGFKHNMDNWWREKKPKQQSCLANWSAKLSEEERPLQLTVGLRWLKQPSVTVFSDHGHSKNTGWTIGCVRTRKHQRQPTKELSWTFKVQETVIALHRQLRQHGTYWKYVNFLFDLTNDNSIYVGKVLN